jgi:LPS-assembly lipoprotein
MSRAVFLTSWLSSVLLLGSFLALSGCGFQPLYGTKPAKEENTLLAGVTVDPIPERLGQQFRINLEDQLNPGGAVPANSRYRLSAALRISEAGIGVARDGTVSRYNVYLDSDYTLTRIADGQKMISGQLRQVSSYNNITNEYYSTYVAKEDAYKRGVEALAQLYRQRLMAYLSENNGNPSPREQPTTPVPQLPVPQNPADPNKANTPIENLYGFPTLGTSK